MNSMYLKSRVQYDFLNKFNYKNIYDIPKIEKIDLSFDMKKPDVGLLVTSLVALEMLTHKKGYLIRARTYNLGLKISKGDPIGSRVTLRKKVLLYFISKLIKNRNLLNKKDKLSLSFQIKNIMTFPEMEANYYFFRKLKSLNLVLNSSAKTKEEFNFLLRSYNIKCRNDLRVEYNLAKVKVRVRVSFFAK